VIRHVRIALRIGVAVGAVLGVAEGIATLSRNIYAPHFALFCLAAPTVLTTIFAVAVALALGAYDKLRPRSGVSVPARLTSQLVASLAGAWLLLWWVDLARDARQVGGGGIVLFALLPPLLVLAVCLGNLVRRVLNGVDERTARRWIGRLAAVGAVVNTLALVPLAFHGVAEGRRYLYDTSHGPTRASAEYSVVLITIDTLRADRLAAWGGADSLMPRLDALARDGVSFTNAITPSPWTLPAVASIFTGLLPRNHGAGRSLHAFDPLNCSPLPDQVWTLTQALHQQGYVTQAFVTNPYLSMRYGAGNGFDRFENVTMESEAFLALERTLVFRLLTAVWPSVVIGDIGETVTRRALPWLERHRTEKFFLWLHYLDVHAPYGDPRAVGHKSFRGELLGRGTLRGLVGLNPDGDLGDRFVPIARLRSGEIRLTPRQRKQLVALYDAGIRYEDEQIRRVLDELDRLGLREDTLVIVVSDQGEEFWEHGGVEHGHTVYDELLRVPLIMRWPGRLPAGKRVEAVARLTDIAPSVLDLLGFEPPAGLDGATLAPLVEDRDAARRVAVAENLLFAEERVALRTQDRKYIRWANGKEEMYDLTNDPRELRDLAGSDETLQPLRELYAAVVGNRAGPVGASVPGSDPRTENALRALGYAP
jgi:arylsulfatase A-like enzyme